LFVIGTAGHVDHGKSTLVKAISGINPDRLREEQEREMTIDLGFAWVTLPSGREISIVDVPGHEDLIKNMLAGVGGIDLAMLVVAADEAVMPQTREHLAILDLLQIPRGLIVLTKADLVDDPVWLDLVSEEVREVVAGTALADAPITPVSAVTGQGLDELLHTLDALLAEATPREDLGFPRLPIDRVFTISGFGTIVTGTLTGGHLQVGDTVEIVPGKRTARIRGLQSHQTKIERADPGARVAVNLSGIDVDALSRGQVLALPGALQATRLVDVQLRIVADAPWPVEHGMAVELFTGAASALARVRLLDCDALGPGETAWAQLRLREPVAASRYDRFIIRLPSPSVTLGGGQIVEPQPARRHRRHDRRVIQRLAALAQGDPNAILMALLEERGPMSARDLLRQSQLPAAMAQQALQALLGEGRILSLGEPPEGTARTVEQGGLLLTAESWQLVMERAAELLQRYHGQNRLREGMPREELKSRLGIEGEPGNQILQRARKEGLLRVTGETVALAQHEVRLSAAEQEAIGQVMAGFEAAPYTPPAYQDVETSVGPELAQYLLESGRLVRLSDAVVFAPEALEQMLGRLRAHLEAHSAATVAEVRDLFDTSRKYAVAFLEETDRRRITKRVGDTRVLR
jgi:selenocysteine-specific elongation factor